MPALRHLRFLPALAALLGLFASPAPAFAQQVSFESLLLEMANRDSVAWWPEPEYRCVQASSYDRDSVAPDQPGWFANWDRSQFLRVEERDGAKEYVLMEDHGPGAVVRFWATWHGPGGGPFSNGTLRFYLDGAEEPVIEGPIAELISGGALVGAPFSQSVSPQTDYARRGHNLYLPIPYAEGCKITYSTAAPIDRGAKEGEALYYQINYRRYESGAKLRSFRMRDLEEHAALIERVGAMLGELVLDGELRPMSGTPLDQELPPGRSGDWISFEGPKAIRYLVLRLDADDLGQALRSTVLELHFDGEATVWCPVGELFGSGPAPREFATFWTRGQRVGEDYTLFCAWPMPFARGAELRFHNLSEQPVSVRGTAIAGRWNWDLRSMHFHADWHQLAAVDTRGGKGMDGQGAFDVNYLTAEGRGVYVGDTLSLFNGANAWWGEGDEKIWVDGEDFPSHFGTGTEDYYGYAWCRPETFSSPWHAQPDGAGNLRVGASTNSRYRILDGIPFRRRLQFDMELWHWAGTGMDYAPASFWYARPGASDNVAPDPAAAARRLSRQRSDVVEVFRVPGALEGEDFAVLACSGGRTEIQDLAQFGWSDERQLWWIDGAPGDRLELGFDAPGAGRYAVSARLTRANDYGLLRLALNGAEAGDWDRYHQSVETTEVALGEFELKAAGNRLTVEILGRNEAALPRHMFGLDALLLTPIEEAP